MKDYIANRELKPLVLGEAIAADTWTEPSDAALRMAAEKPAHGDLSVVDGLRWQREMKTLAQQRNRRFDPAQLLPQSRHYGMLMRKFQIETYHREVPRGGYVVSVIRDFPKAAMGLINFENQPKHPAEDWAFQNDLMLILSTENDRRSFTGETATALALTLKNDSPSDVGNGRLEICLLGTDGSIESRTELETKTVTGGSFANRKWTLTLPKVEAPTRFRLKATWSVEAWVASNEWPLWVFPQPATDHPEFVIHSSADEIAAQIEVEPLGWQFEREGLTGSDNAPILARHFDSELLQRLIGGARVLMIPDGQAGSFPLTEHWFLRGAPVIIPRVGEAWHQPFEIARSGQTEPQNMLIELQHFDLAGPVIANLDDYLSLVDPAVVLWDNHDLSVVKTHGLVFEMGVGQGRLLVSTLNHTGQTNAAGRWLFGQFRRQLLNHESSLGLEVRTQTQARLAAEVNRRSATAPPTALEIPARSQGSWIRRKMVCD